MMCDEKASRSRRALAVLLTLVLLLGLIPGGALTVAAAGDSTVAVVVTDETGAPLPGARVTYTVTSQTNGVVASASGQTDANGSIAVLRQESFAENDLTLTASATKDGYVYAAGSSALQSAAISAPQQEFPLQLRSTAITGVTVAAKAGLVYTGEPMTLVTVTGAEDTNLYTVSYEIDGKAAEKPERTDAGTYQVKVTVAREGYDTLVETCDVTIQKASVPGVTLEGKNLTYNGKMQDLTNTPKFEPGDTVEWTLDNVKLDGRETPQAKDAGTYKVGLKVSRGENYSSEFSVDATINPQKLDISGLTITSKEDLVFNGKEQNPIASIEGKSDDYELKFSRDGHNWQAFDPNDKENAPTVRDAGEYTWYFRAEKDKNTETPIKEFKFSVKKAAYTVEFAKEPPQRIENIGATQSFKVKVDPKSIIDYDEQKDNLKIEYAVDDKDLAEINDDGVLTTRGFGQVTVTATVSGIKNYEDKTVKHTFTIGKDSDFLDCQGLTYTLGENNGTIVLDGAVIKKQKEDAGKLSYHLDDSNLPKQLKGCFTIKEDTKGPNVKNEICIAKEDYPTLIQAMESGEVSFAVGVTKAASLKNNNGSKNMPEAKGTFTVTIQFAKAPENVLNIQDKDGNTQAWYSSGTGLPVITSASDAYTLAYFYENDTVADINGNAQPFTRDGTAEALRVVYPQNVETGAISRVPVSINIDQTPPVLTVTPTTPSNITDGAYYYGKDKPEVTLKFELAEKNPKDAAVTVTNQTGQKKKLTNWTQTEDGYEATYKVGGDTFAEGEYVLSFAYTDQAGNPANVKFVSAGQNGGAAGTSQNAIPKIVIDRTDPVIKINHEAANTGARHYYQKGQTATVEITDKNFDTSTELTITPTTPDTPTPDPDASTSATLPNDATVISSEWSQKAGTESTYQKTIEFNKDANYTLSVTCADLAKNTGKTGADGQAKDLYVTVDGTQPHDVTVAYREPVSSAILNAITFGYYQQKVEVTVTAQDDTAGVDRFDYSYLKAAGVSAVNAELVDQIMQDAQVTYPKNDGGKTAQIKFSVPKDALGPHNQFNGTVQAKATDRAGNASDQTESQRIVVDNIAPTAVVNYNAPVNQENGISYYDGNITGTITIQEANFYANDVKVTVTRDGGGAQALATKWTDRSTDVHVGTFTLSGDADYVVSIAYTDRSGNRMTPYQSNQMTIDTQIEAPSFTINGAPQSGDNGGAYKEDAEIAFHFEDENFADQTVKLTRVRFDETKDVTEEFIQVAQTGNGGEGSFTIPEEVAYDGIYTLTASITDKAGHSAESHVKFTINRFGSVYEYSDYLVSLIRDGGQYIPLDGDAAITKDLVITEYNADRIVKGSLQIMITRDGEKLDADYTATPEPSPTVTTGTSGWYQYVYAISKDNFLEDGVYHITLTSKDATENTSTSVPENSIDEQGAPILDEMTFTVDTTAPEIRNVVNLDKKIVNAPSLTVQYTLVDVGGLAQAEVLVAGKAVETITDFDGEENNFSGKFTLEEKNDAQDVRIKVVDRAGNVTDTASDGFDPGDRYVFNGSITLSTNFFVRWYANTPLFWGSIGGVLLLIAALVFLLASKRKKKTEAAAS